ncbi:MATE family efflux transporter [Haliangium sp.]|uniref:MATE family efflux transporter n=1 Tax=Haliangium sp. TaxID=2663208 RepID=UPI003D142D71
MSSPSAPKASVGTLLSLGWPVIVARSTQSIIGFADAYMIASLGEDALAATTTGALNAFALAILPMGAAFIVQSFAAQLAGKRDYRGARRYGWYGLTLAAFVLVLGAAAVPAVGPTLGLFPYEPEVHRLMTAYLEIRLYAVGAFVGTEVLGNWYAGLGNTRLQMIAGILSMVINVALNWVLIYGHLGAPAMGVEGAALASVIAAWCGFGLLLAVFLRGWGAPRITGPLGLKLSELGRMLRFGLPNGINWFLEFAAFTIFINVVVGTLGTVAHAALMVVIQINSVSFMPAFGLSSAGAILAGQAIGARALDAVPGIVWRTLKVTAGWQCAVGALYVIMPGALMSLFDTASANAAEMLALGASMLALSAAWQLFDAVGMVVGEALRAAGDTAWCMWARLALGWLVFTPVAVLAVNVLGGGPVAAILSLVLYMVLLAAALTWRFMTGRWRSIDLTGTELPLPVADPT